jgi:hypothetical protein
MTNITTSNAFYNWKIIGTDILVLVLVYFIPALTHFSPFPLYYLDPMRLLLFAGFLISRNHANAYLLAITIPLFSTIVSGHPPFYKALLISIELFTNIFFFYYLLNKIKWNTGIIIFISTVISKLIYYAFKYIFIRLALIDGNLITTSVLIQLPIIIGLSLLFNFFYKRQKAA